MTTAAHRSEDSLRATVVEELDFAPDVVADHLDVSCTGSAVVLSGHVSSCLERSAAVRAVLRVRGVTALAVRVEVRNRWGSRSDRDIAREAATALGARVVPVSGTVTARVEDHEVTLTGAVAWDFERTAAIAVVEGLVGVTAVHDAIRLEPQLPFSARDARARIDAFLVRHAHIDAARVRVGVEGSEIVLSGTVASWSEHGDAGWAAWATPGVSRVTNRLRVVA